MKAGRPTPGPGALVVAAGWLTLSLGAVAMEDIRFETESGDALPEAKQDVAESVLDTDVLQPGVYRLDVDVDSRQVRIIEARPEADASESGHRTEG
ncbi:hypothetical protein [Aquisalimonas asiatica]|uniref:Uncharacterized protein n=1 Tax=Aquisalimonas asiatica TaxID=406100 RepID=A0A1H8UAL5_9GAMM|nr:hypothetical protein [Aquisalimonas asiatica]SEO99883.1 hypothetical protein SAMN04488052_10619 [Aquisalimonas asiatica]